MINFNPYNYENYFKRCTSRKVGHWIERVDERGDVYYECSNCEEAFTFIEGTPADNLYNYCSNCGAKMEENENE